MLSRLRRAYPLALELVPLLLLGWSLYLLLSAYPQLPGRIPTHFDLAGNPDRWGSKVNLVVALLLSGLVYLGNTTFALALATVADFRPLVNLPGKRQGLTVAQGEAVRAWVLRLLYTVKTLAVGLIALVVYNSIQIAFGRRSDLGKEVLYLVVAISLVTAFVLWQMLRAIRRPPELT